MGKRKKGAFHNPTSANLSPTRERLRKTAEERKNAGEQSEAQASLQACADMFDPSGLDQYDYSSTLEQTPQQISSVLINYYRSLQIKLLLYPDCKLPLCDHFIELSIQSGNVYQKTIDSYLAPQALNGEDSYEASTNLYGLKSGIIQPNNILTKEGDNKALILGTAGIGKSTLSDYLCSLYAERKLGYKWVFKLPLRSLTKDRYRNSQEKIKLIDVLERECLSVACSSDPDNFKLSKKSKHLLADALKECTKKNEVLIIADGIDELIDHLTESTRVLLKKLLTFKQLIVTTRPYNLHQLRRDLEFEHTSLYEITGFPEKTIAKYSEDFFLATSVKEESNIDGFKSFLLQNPHINGACRIPIYLELLCSAWKHQPISIEIYNITSIYSLVVTFIGRRYLSKAGIATNDLLNSVIQDKCKNPLGTLEHLGFHSITHGKVYFKLDASLDYLQSLKPAVDISDVIVKDQKEFGFIRPNNPSGEYDGSGVFYFNHLTFRDFFAARFMVSCLQQESQPSANASFVTSFVHLWPKPNEHTLQDFILQKRHDEKYEFIWWFMVGLLNDARDIKSIEYFFKILFGFEDLIEISNFLLLIRCLDEAGSYQEQIANSIFNYIKRWLELTFKPQLNIVLGTYIHSQLLNRLKISPTIFTASLIQDPLIELIEECDTEELLRILYFLERLNHKFPKTLEKAIIQKAFVEWPDNNFRAKLTTQIAKLCHLALFDITKIHEIFKEMDVEDIRLSVAIEIILRNQNFPENRKEFWISKLFEIFLDDQKPSLIRKSASCVISSNSELPAYLISLIEEEKSLSPIIKEMFLNQGVLQPKVISQLLKSDQIDVKVKLNIIEAARSISDLFAIYREFLFQVILQESYVNDSRLKALHLWLFCLKYIGWQGEESLHKTLSEIFKDLLISSKARDEENCKIIYLNLLNEIFNSGYLSSDSKVGQLYNLLISVIVQNLTYLQSDVLKSYCAICIAFKVQGIPNKLLPIIFNIIIDSSYTQEDQEYKLFRLNEDELTDFVCILNEITKSLLGYELPKFPKEIFNINFQSTNFREEGRVYAVSNANESKVLSARGSILLPAQKGITIAELRKEVVPQDVVSEVPLDALDTKLDTHYAKTKLKGIIKMLATLNHEQFFKENSTAVAQFKALSNFLSTQNEPVCTWTDLLNCFLLISETNKANQSHEAFVEKLIESRDELDLSFYKRALCALFGDDDKTHDQMTFNYHIDWNQNSGLNDNATGYRLVYHALVVKSKSYDTQGNELLRVAIKAPGSRDLISDIDTSIEVEYYNPSICDKIVLPQHLEVDFKNSDLATLIQALLVYHFNALNLKVIGLTGALSRDSNAYAKDNYMMRTSKPGSKPDTYKERIKFEKARLLPKKLLDDLVEQDKEKFKHLTDKTFYAGERVNHTNKALHPYKQTKERQELAASLFSIREYFGNDSSGKNAWKKFTNYFITTNPFNEENKQIFKDLIEETIKQTDDWYQTYDRKLNELTKGNDSNAEAFKNRYYTLLDAKVGVPDKVPSPNRQADMQLHAKNELYVEHLMVVAKKQALVDSLDDNLSGARINIEKAQADLIKRALFLKKKFTERDNALKNAENKPDDLELEELEENVKTAQDKRARSYIAYKEALKAYETKLREHSQALNALQAAQIEASLYAHEAYVNFSALYDTVYRCQSGQKDLILRKHAALCSMLQQIGFYLLHGKHYKEKLCISDRSSLGKEAEVKIAGEMLYRTAKYLNRIADVIFDKQDSDKLLHCLDEVGVARDKLNLNSAIYSLLQQGKQMVKEVKKEVKIRPHEKSDIALLIAFRQYLVEQENKANLECADLINDIKPLLTNERYREGFADWVLDFNDGFVLELAQKLIMLTFHIKITKVQIANPQAQHVRLWGHFFKNDSVLIPNLDQLSRQEYEDTDKEMDHNCGIKI